MYGRAGTIAIPTAVGPQRFMAGLADFANALLACLTAVWIVNAGRAMDARDWKTARLTATIPRRVGSEKFAASMGVGPCSFALYVVHDTSPIRYAHEIPYAAVTTVRLKALQRTDVGRDDGTERLANIARWG